MPSVCCVTWDASNRKQEFTRLTFYLNLFIILKSNFSRMHLNGKTPSIFLVKIFLGYPSGETDPGHTGGITYFA